MFLWKVVSGELLWLLVLKAVSCSRPLFRMSRHWLTTASCATSLEVARGPERMLDTLLCSTIPPCKCGDIYPSTVAEIRHAQTNVFVFALVTALLPESTQTGNHWPEPVRPGGVQQPEEAGAQGGGCVHRPWQGWQGWSPGWVHSLPSVLLLKSSALSVHYCPPCPSVRYSFESFAVCLWININPCEVVDAMPGVFTSFQRVSFEDENKKNVCLPLKNPWRFFADFKTSSKPTAGTNIKISGFHKYKGINVGITQPNDHVFTCQPLTTSLTPSRQLCRMRGCQNSNGDATCK